MPKILAPKADTAFRNAAPKDKPFLVADCKGLALQVNPDGMKRWLFRYSFGGKERKLTIKDGFYPKMGLSVAREEARVLRDTVARGEDPGEVRKAIRTKVQEDEIAKAAEEAHNAATFQKVAGDWFAHASEHLSPSNAADTWRRLALNVFPWIGSKPIADIRPPDVLAPLRLVEERGARESAHRILGVCGQIFRYAVASGLVESDPCRDLRGALARPKHKHFGALTKPEDVAGYLRTIETYQGSLETRTALALGILTFVRPGNLRTAEWSEFHDLDSPDDAEWRIPGDKMKVKTDRPFVVPLAPQAVQLLETLRPLTGRGRYLWSKDKPMSNNTILAALRRMGYTSDEMTGHGVRAMARTITHEVLGFAPEVIEEQLAHGKSGPLGGAYDRTTHMPERRRLMREWADYLDGLKNGDVK